MMRMAAMLGAAMALSACASKAPVPAPAPPPAPAPAPAANPYPNAAPNNAVIPGVTLAEARPRIEALIAQCWLNDPRFEGAALTRAGETYLVGEGLSLRVWELKPTIAVVSLDGPAFSKALEAEAAEAAQGRLYCVPAS